MTPNQIQSIINQTKKPLAYLEGYTWFYGRKFTVTPDVLIPRPETEDIINLAKTLVGISSERIISPVKKSDLPSSENLSERSELFSELDVKKTFLHTRANDDSEEIPDKRPLQILDLGTGSGAIAIILALELKNAEITAADISEKALEIAKINARNHQQMHMHFALSDLCKGLQNQQFDLIAANLPYVDETWPWLDKAALSYEPAQALYAKDHGLQIIKKFLSETPHHLTKNAHILLEADPSQHNQIIAHAKKHHLRHVQTRNYILHFTCQDTLPAQPTKQSLPRPSKS